MEQAEMQAILSHVFNRLHRLETDMSVLQGKEKDLRTIVTDGFLEMRQTFAVLEDQIDTLAISTNTRFDHLEKRMDIMDDRMYILDTRTQDMSLKLNKICEHMAIT